MMHLIKKIKPKFWDGRASATAQQALFDYRRIWVLSIMLLIIVSLLPLSMFLIFNFNLAFRTINNENHLRTARITSNTRRTLTFFLEERLDALRFIAQGKSIEVLKSNVELLSLLRNLQMGFGGYIDIGLINEAVPFEKLEETVRERAEQLASIPASQLAAMKLVVNHAFENMGISSTQVLGPILDGLMRNTPDALAFVNRARDEGVRAVIEARDGLFGDYSQAPSDEQPDPSHVIVP